MRILKLNNIDDIQRESGVSVVKRAKLVGSNTVCRYRLLEELTFQLTNGEIITVPVGFEWDLSSSPRWAWWLAPPDGDFDSASLIHDYIYINRPFGRGERARWFADWHAVMSTNLVSSSILYFFKSSLYTVIMLGAVPASSSVLIALKTSL